MRQESKNRSGQQKEETKQMQKERIWAFDREVMANDTDRTVALKFLCIIMSVFGCFLMIFPFAPAREPGQRVIYILAWLFLGMAVIFRIQPYIYVMGDARRVYAMLAYIPVDKALICQVRREYLRRYLLKIGILCFILQQLGALFDSAWSIWNLIYPAGMILSLYLAGVAYIGWK